MPCALRLIMTVPRDHAIQETTLYKCSVWQVFMHDDDGKHDAGKTPWVEPSEKQFSGGRCLDFDTKLNLSVSQAASAARP
jgi:hypothetical protein